MLRHKTFQNKIAVSRFSLPVTATLIAMIWVAVGLVQGDIWTELAFALASTLLMVELNNRNALMRTYSRMVSCSFLTLITATTLPEPIGAHECIAIVGTAIKTDSLRVAPSMLLSAWA